ncbi:MAG: hypothetical protein N2037_02540 [Acidimicrobiales bacterium]|nr:hypothetical protein [Acidimicrobiales bacterium]
MRRVFGAVLIFLTTAVGVVGCGGSRTSTDLGATLPPAPTPVAGAPSAASVSSTTTVTKNASPACKASDEWGLAYLRVTDPAQAGGLTPQQLTSLIQEKATAFKTLVPEQATNIDAVTASAVKKLDGTSTEADAQAGREADEKLDAWYAATCR